MVNELKAYVAERDEVLRSLDVDRMLNFTHKWNPYLPTPSREVAEIALHKARTGSFGLSREERQFSKQWLSARGYKSLDDGDL